MKTKIQEPKTPGTVEGIDAAMKKLNSEIKEIQSRADAADVEAEKLVDEIKKMEREQARLYAAGDSKSVGMSDEIDAKEKKRLSLLKMAGECRRIADGKLSEVKQLAVDAVAIRKQDAHDALITAIDQYNEVAESFGACVKQYSNCLRVYRGFVPMHMVSGSPPQVLLRIFADVSPRRSVSDHVVYQQGVGGWVR